MLFHILLLHSSGQRIGKKKRINRYVGAFYQQYQPYDNENDDDYYYYDNDGLVYGISHCCSLNIKSSVVIHNLHPNMLYAWVSLCVFA